MPSQFSGEDCRLNLETLPTLGTPMANRQSLLEDISKAKDRAQDLLDSLLDARAQSAPRMMSDLYKRVTGASSLDNAILSTKRMVEAYGRMLGDLQRQGITVTKSGIPALVL